MKTIPALLLAGLLGVSAAHAQPAAPAAADQPEPPKISKAGDDFITLNFSNIDIAALVKVMSEFTRRNFILDEKVTGKVTLMTPTRISPEEAYQVFLSALEIKGFTAVEDGRIIRIVSTAAVRQSGLRVMEDGDMKGEGYVTKLIRMTYVNPQEIVRTLTPLITKDGNLIAYPATNSLIITDSVSAIRKIEKLVSALDVPTPTGKGKINVYYLKHASSEDISKVMQALVSRLPAPPAAGAAQPTGPATILEGAVTITADKLTNSLIIVASPIDYETMKDVIQKLDIRRRQVYVEAAIVEMGLSKSRELGFEFQAANLNKLNNGGTSVIGGTNFGGIGAATVGGPAAFANFNGLAVGAVKGTFTYKGTEFLNIGALLRALQSDTDVNVLSTPNILTSDNQKAEIMVGENVPFKTGQSQSAATGGSSILTTIERKDVGISLKITPQITSEDNVRLELYQEISNVVESATPNSDGPTTSKRSASTTVVIKDHETMVIGGLIRDNVVSSERKVPFLGDIPLLGWLFKYKNTRVEKTNLMIFITPYIIKNEQDAAEITRRQNATQEEFRKDQRFEKKGKEPVMPGAEKKEPAGQEIEKKETGKIDADTKALAAPRATDAKQEGPADAPAAPVPADKPTAPAEKTPAPAEGGR
ncbi:MAG: secretin N-terminal domain-containing protein [Nitrospirota bacterium]